MCVCDVLLCMCVSVQKAPVGMNYLEESLLRLSTVDWPQARTVLLLTTQEATPNSPSAVLQCAPVSPYNTTPAFPACPGAGPLQSILIIEDPSKS